jgi:transposase InsO family protein
MNKPLVSPDELSRCWDGKTVAAILKMGQRKQIAIIWVDKSEAEKKELDWGKGCSGGKNGNKRAFIPISQPSIPSSVRLRYYESLCPPALNPPGTDPQKGVGELGPPSLPVPGVPTSASPDGLAGLTDDEIYRHLYLESPVYNRHKADKYEVILAEMAGLDGQGLKRAINEWNQKHPDFHTSYPRVTQARKAVETDGKAALLGKYGKSRESKIKDEWYRAFESRYLKEGRPSLHSCWLGALGEAKGLDSTITPARFPSETTFLREIRRKVPAQTICYYREGSQAWKGKYGCFLDRDYTDMSPGEVYVSDHAQIDVAVRLPNGKLGFPWVTVISDMRSDKYLGWSLYPDNPNSNRIFEAFHRAVRDYGVPRDLIIDNGKDYRCFDLAGGRKTVRVGVDEMKTTAVVIKLGITPHFALPYTPQTKTVERTFLRNKEWFSKHMPGYRGGNVKERPGVLNDEIKQGKILEWADFEKLMDDFFITVANRMQSNGKKLMGACPDELFEKGRKAPVRVREDSLAILCMRSSKPRTIGRNGIHDADHDAWLWGEWMEAYKGQRVYMRRDSKNWKTAWIFTADGADRYLGEAVADRQPPALARTDEEKAIVRDHLARQRRGTKFAKQAAGTIERRSPGTLVSDMARGAQLLNEERNYTPGQEQPKVIEARSTVFDGVSKERERQAKLGTSDLSIIVPRRPEKKEIFYGFKADKRRAEQLERERARSKNL